MARSASVAPNNQYATSSSVLPGTTSISLPRSRSTKLVAKSVLRVLDALSILCSSRTRQRTPAKRSGSSTSGVP
jgi:hypothetical protein